MHLQRAEPSFGGMKQEQMKNIVITRGQLEKQNLEPLNCLGILLNPILHLILKILKETKLNQLKEISALMVVPLSIRCIFIKASHAASRPPVPVHYVQSVWILTKKTPPPNLRSTRFFHCIYNMFCSYYMIVVTITIKTQKSNLVTRVWNNLHQVRS